METYRYEYDVTINGRHNVEDQMDRRLVIFSFDATDEGHAQCRVVIQAMNIADQRALNSVRRIVGEEALRYIARFGCMGGGRIAKSLNSLADLLDG